MAAPFVPLRTLSGAPIRLYRYITDAWQRRRLTLAGVAIYAGGNPRGQEAKGERDSGQMQAPGEEKQTQTNAGTFESNNVCAVDCDISINVVTASSD